MRIANRLKKNMVPVLFAVGIVIVLVAGLFFIRAFLERQTFQERAYQLEEMTDQIRVNLNSALDNHWNFLAGIENAENGKTYADDNDFVDEIGRLEVNFDTENYSSRLMFLGSNGMVYLNDGKAGIWDDVSRIVDGEERHTFVTDTSNVDGVFLAFVQELAVPVTIEEDDKEITHIILLKDIAMMKQYYTSESYGGYASVYILKENGILAYYDAEENVLGARNVLKRLENAEHYYDDSFDKISASLEDNGIAVAGISLDSEDYFYCLANLDEYNLIMLFLIPADVVAVNTVDMMNSVILVFVFLSVILAVLFVLGMIFVGRMRRSEEMIRIEQENSREMNKLRVAAEDAFREAEAANQSKSVFLSNMSHDIRTPMNAVIGYATLAAANAEDADKVKDYLTKILSAGNHLLSLINDILDMSRIESGKIHLEETEANLSEILHDLKTIINGQIHAKQLELFMDAVDVTDEDVFCDKMRMNQVLLNLLSNAIKFTPSGGTISVRVVQLNPASDGKARYEIRVKDSGIGMSPEFASRIFEPFEREHTSTVSKIQGTGLGMAITKNIIDMMGGTIEVRTEQDKGTEFIIGLTLRVGSGRPVEEKIAELEGLRALVVDDDFDTCDSVTRMLQRVGMRSEWSLRGSEAVLRARQCLEMGDGFHAYIIDWRLPDMNGIEVTRQIRRLGDDTPIIILTAYDWTDIDAEAREAGVTAFCSKPMFMSDLRRSLLTALGHRQETEREILPAADDSAEFSGKHILLAEDNELNREIALEILGEYGFRISTAENGAQAVERIADSRPGDYDLVLMDIQMPIMDGCEATKCIRELKDPGLNSVPIIAMTANAFEEDRKNALECGMDGFLSKPIKIEEVLQELHRVFTARASTRASQNA